LLLSEDSGNKAAIVKPKSNIYGCKMLGERPLKFDADILAYQDSEDTSHSKF